MLDYIHVFTPFNNNVTRPYLNRFCNTHREKTTLSIKLTTQQAIISYKYNSEIQMSPCTDAEQRRYTIKLLHGKRTEQCTAKKNMTADAQSS